MYQHSVKDRLVLHNTTRWLDLPGNHGEPTTSPLAHAIHIQALKVHTSIKHTCINPHVSTKVMGTHQHIDIHAHLHVLTYAYMYLHK